jgi:hypothetical protein
MRIFIICKITLIFEKFKKEDYFSKKKLENDIYHKNLIFISPFSSGHF